MEIVNNSITGKRGTVSVTLQPLNDQTALAESRHIHASLELNGTETQMSLQSALNSLEEAVSTASGFNTKFVTAVPKPADATANVIYLVPVTSGSTTTYQQWMLNTETHTMIQLGTATVDLTGYVEATDLNAITDTTISNLDVDIEE